MSVKAANNLFEVGDDLTRPAMDAVQVPAGGSVEIIVTGLPEGTCITLSGVYSNCGEAPQRWPVLDKCGCPRVVVGPCDHAGFIRECGDYELHVDGDLGDATIKSIVRDGAKQSCGCN